MKPNVESPLRLGNSVFIRTVTFHYTGRVVGLTKDDILLADAAWIPDSGRWSNALTTGELSEIEPYPDKSVVSISRGSVVDTVSWDHALPRKVK